MTIKELRNRIGLTQVEAVKLTGVPLRTFKLYENDESRIGTVKYKYIMDVLQKIADGKVKLGGFDSDSIKRMLEPLLVKSDTRFCILYGAYVTGTAAEDSKVKLVISTGLSGIAFFKLEAELSEALGREVDLVDADQLPYDPNTLNQVLKEGIRIYG